MALQSVHLFAGAGGGILADLLLGHRPIAACEIEKYPREVLLQRQRDGFLPDFPVWDDIRTLRSDNPDCAAAFDKWRSIRDSLVICGGFPCQDISSARTNSHVNGAQQGLLGPSSGLWHEMARSVAEVRPRFVFAENSPNLRVKGLEQILALFDGLGYYTRRIVLGSKSIGADHHRKRMWILAYTDVPQRERGGISGRIHEKNAYISGADWRESESRMERIAYGVANRSHRLKAVGNGQDCRVAATAWNILTHDLEMP